MNEILIATDLVTQPSLNTSTDNPNETSDAIHISNNYVYSFQPTWSTESWLLCFFLTLKTTVPCSATS
jgi:hypothetical protein